ncbi:ATP-binding protein [Streptomyces cyaneofuscatus]|uniref:ATP-binding protein n=1 Tax=Streptomyces cyaneofuscatus TaxID=66883 RepID=UPI00344516F8
MTKLTVKVGGTHLESLIKKPLHGVAEMIWNGLDADAGKVTVDVKLDALGAIDAVVIKDDGTGMTKEQAEKCFSFVGDSWKAERGRSLKEGRALHGREGQGRWSAFSIGDRVKWVSTAEYPDGQNRQITIRGLRGDLQSFDVSDPIPTSDAPGTSVEIDLITTQASVALDRPNVETSLAVIFALYLEAYPVVVSWRGIRISGDLIQDNRTDFVLSVDGVDEEAKLTVIEWKKKIPRSLFLCDQNGMALHEIQPGIQAPGFDFTAYLRRGMFREIGHDILLAEMEHEEISPWVEAARSAMRVHFKERSIERRKQLISQWKQEGTYPYKGVPVTGVEVAEREMFDVVALAASKAVETSDRTGRKLSLRLLRESLESRPGALQRVLAEVLELPDERIEELDRLLARGASLPSIISASKTIADRLDFLTGLDVMLFDRESRRTTLERKQLHRILAQETWLFGEEYALTGDDERLTSVLRKYLHMLDQDVNLADEREVLRDDGSQAIVDLMLSRQVQHHDNHVENLVIELKRPNVIIGRDQITQIEEYAFAVASDERFAQPNASWEFWIVGNDMNPTAKRKAGQSHLPPGVVHQDGNVRIWAKTWAEIIGDARHRLKFVERSLEYMSTRDNGLQYLRETHARYLPTVLQESA